jgi:hypothetical protein
MRQIPQQIGECGIQMPAAANHIAGVNYTRMIPIKGPAYPGKGGAFAPHIFVRVAVRGLSSQFPAEIHRDMPRVGDMLAAAARK